MNFAFHFSLLFALSLGAAPAKPQNAAYAPSSRIERAAAAVVAKYSQQELREVMGFFAPVVKKWRPTAEKFGSEYTASTNRTAVISRYLPKARQALEDARRMRLPPKYEPQREKYLTVAEALYMTISLYMKFEK